MSSNKINTQQNKHTQQNTQVNAKIKKQLVILEDAFYDGIDNVISQHPDIRHFSTVMNQVINNINNIIEQNNFTDCNTSGNDKYNMDKEKNIDYAQLETLSNKQ